MWWWKLVYSLEWAHDDGGNLCARSRRDLFAQDRGSPLETADSDS